jgi:hypothetical protein
LNTYKPSGSTFNLIRGRYAPLKKEPKSWPFIDGHNMKAVEDGMVVQNEVDFAHTVVVVEEMIRLVVEQQTAAEVVV